MGSCCGLAIIPKLSLGLWFCHSQLRGLQHATASRWLDFCFPLILSSPFSHAHFPFFVEICFFHMFFLFLSVYFFLKYKVCSMYPTILHVHIPGDSTNYLWLSAGLRARQGISLCVWNIIQNRFGCRNFLWFYLWNYSSGVFFHLFLLAFYDYASMQLSRQRCSAGSAEADIFVLLLPEHKTLGSYRGRGFKSNLFLFFPG